MMVWDSFGADSGWASGPAFYPPKHQYPLVNFTWAPQRPSAGEDVLFADQSTCYGDGGNPVACPIDGFYWTFQDGNPANSSQQNPTIRLTSFGSKQVTLQVTDSDDYMSSFTKSVNVQLSLPGWREILPWNW